MSVTILIAMAMAAEPQVRPNKAEPDRMICKAKPKTGSRVGSKTCRTAAEWDRITEQHRRDAREMVDRPTIETRRGN